MTTPDQHRVQRIAQLAESIHRIGSATAMLDGSAALDVLSEEQVAIVDTAVDALNDLRENLQDALRAEGINL
ncbi:hypothetical protein ACWJWH_18075 [Clostridioides difficile]